MKKTILSFLLLLLVTVATGCTASMGSLTSNHDTDLLMQLNSDQMSPVDAARFERDMAVEKVALANMEEELAEAREDLAGYKLDLARNVEDEKLTKVDIAETEAINTAGLGVAEDNLEALDGYRKDLLSVESKRIDIQAKIRNMENVIANLESDIAAQKQKIADMRAAGVPGKPEAFEVEEAVVPGEAEEDKAVVEPAPNVEPKQATEIPDYLKVEEDPDDEKPQ